MYIYDAITKTGLLIHLSMSEEHTFYIFVFDIDNFKLTMRFFNNIETALAFIQELWLIVTWRVLRGSNSHPRFRRPRWYPFHQRPMVVVVGIDPTSSAYEAGAHPSTPYNLNRFGVTTGNRTQTKRITISVANRYNIATPKKSMQTHCRQDSNLH